MQAERQSPIKGTCTRMSSSSNDRTLVLASSQDSFLTSKPSLSNALTWNETTMALAAQSKIREWLHQSGVAQA